MRITRFPYVQVACQIPLERSWWRLQLCFRPHLNRRSTQSYVPPNVVGVPIVRISKLPFGIPKTKWHLGAGPMARHKVFYNGEGGGSPKSKLWWLLWVHVCLWLICAPKCFDYALTNLLFGLCRSIWVSELLVNLLIPITEL